MLDRCTECFRERRKVYHRLFPLHVSYAVLYAFEYKGLNASLGNSIAIQDVSENEAHAVKLSSLLGN
jgi:hypothetical protein